MPAAGVLLEDLVSEIGDANIVGSESGPFLLQVPVNAEEEAGLEDGSTLTVRRSNVLGAGRSRHFEGTRLYALSSREEGLRVGRGSECEVILEESSASRFHARLWVDKDGDCRLLDHDSQNGTWIGESELPPGLVREVPIGASVRFGRSLCMVLDWNLLSHLLTMVRDRTGKEIVQAA